MIDGKKKRKKPVKMKIEYAEWNKVYVREHAER